LEDDWVIIWADHLEQISLRIRDDFREEQLIAKKYISSCVKGAEYLNENSKGSKN